MGKACGNPKCGVSTGIHDGLTFGSGDLDMNGFWERPCEKCARLHEKLYPEDGKCWPFGPPTRGEMLLAAGHMLEDAQEGIDKLLALLKSLSGTMRDLRDPLLARGAEIVEREVADQLASAKHELDKILIPDR